MGDTASHKEPNYNAIFWWLLAFTVVEVGVIYAHLPRFLLVLALVVLACAKAALVAMYFMHLRFEKGTLITVAIVPLVLVLVLFISFVEDFVLWPF